MEMTKKRTLLTIESLAELASVQPPPCLSLYQPTHRRSPENQQDPIRFRNLVKELETALLQKHPAVETRLLLEPFEELARDERCFNIRTEKARAVREAARSGERSEAISPFGRRNLCRGSHAQGAR
jgi:hypothetical protein